MFHIPVLLKEVIDGLNLHSGDKVVDCTYGDGGHARAILEKIGPSGQLLGLDTDPDNIRRARQNFAPPAGGQNLGGRARESAVSNLLLVNDNFVNLKEIVEREKIQPVRAILLDLGWSGRQLDSGRGFSFRKDEPLDLRLSGRGPTAADLINQASAEELGRIFREYGEERRSREIAKAIVQYRQKKRLERTGELVGIINQTLGFKEGGLRNVRLHPATKVWQALRIAVNQELDNLKKVLPSAVEVLVRGGRLAVITFHSLEDRIVKQYFKSQSGESLKLINKKPIIASRAEIKTNPRSRSAKLRLVERI